MERQGVVKDFITKAGLRAVVVRYSDAGMGTWLCGYVIVPYESPLFGVNESELSWIDVHGSVTYSGELGSFSKSLGLSNPNCCAWVIGFDCHHACDDPRCGGRQKSLSYVVEQCEKLARQIVEGKRDEE